MTRVLILGSGLAGMTVAKRLSRSRAGAGLEVTVVDRRHSGVLLPLLPRVAAGFTEPERAEVDLERALRGVRVVIGEVTGVDPAAKAVALTDGRGNVRAIEYDHLVVTLGGANEDTGVPGVRRHALCLRTTGDAREILSLARENATSSRAIAVVGAGPAGLASAALLARSGLGPVALLDRRPRPLGSFDKEIGDRVVAATVGAGVQWRPESQVAEIGPDSLLLKDGTEVLFSLCVWTAGSRSAPVVESSFTGAEHTTGGRLVTDPMLRVRGATDVWACGDSASVPWLDVGGDCPNWGVFARAQAERLASNLSKIVGGDYPRSFRRDPPVLVPVGPHSAVGTFRGRKLSGRAGILAWAAGLGLFGHGLLTPQWRGAPSPTEFTPESHAEDRTVALATVKAGSGSSRVSLGPTRRNES